MKPLAPLLRYGLGGLELLIALNAFLGGWYGMSGAPGVPVEWLAGSPFHDYFIPAVVLLVVVGGSTLLAGIGLLRNSRWALAASYWSGLLLLGWIGVQIILIGYVSWLQPAMAVAALTILLLPAVADVLRRAP